jgi:nucleoside-diphosphate-sugar epimerase
VIPWVKRATLTLLEAAASQQSVKRVVLTSSSAAALIPIPNETGIRVDESKPWLLIQSTAEGRAVFGY